MASSKVKNSKHLEQDALTSQANLELLPLIVNNFPQAVFWKDQDLVFLGCNQVFAEDAGLETPAEIVGKTDYDLPWTDQADLYRADDLEVLKSGEAKINYEEPQTNPAGETTWLRTSKIPVRDDSGNVVAVLGMYEDITAEKQAEQSVQDNEERMRAIYEGSNDAIMLLTPEGFFDCNPRTLELFGFESVEEFTQVHPADISPPHQPDGSESFPAAQERIKTAYEQGSNRFEWVHRHTNGEDFPAEVLLSAFEMGGETVLQATVRDITRRKQIEADLKREQQFSDLVIESLPGVFYIFDTEGKLIRWNNNYERLSGYSAEELGSTTNAMDPIYEEDREYAAKAIEKVFVEGFADAEIRTKRGTGEIDTLYFTTSRMQIGDELYAVGSGIDITDRKKAEQALKEEQERLQNILESISVPIIISRLSDSKVLYANQALADVGQIDLDTLIGGRTVDYFVDPADRDKVAEILSQVGHVDAFETQLRRGNDEIYWALLSAHIINYQGDVCVFTSYTDISDYREAEEDIRQEKALSDAVINGLPGIFYLFETDGSMVRWNEEYEKVTGYNTEEMATRNALDAIADEDKEITLAAIERVFEEGQASVEANIQTRDGERIPYFFAGRRVQIGDEVFVAGTGYDIAERKQAEERSLTFQALTENAADAIAMSDLQGKITFANRATYRFFGLDYEKQELIGYPSSSLMPLQEQEQRDEIIDQVMATGGGRNEETTISRPDGSKVDVLITVFPVLDTRGQPAYLGAILHDITERKKLQAQVQEAFERRGEQVQISTEIAQEIAQASELSELFERVVTLTKERLGYYHTQLLQYDPTQDAVVLITGYGETGDEMLAEGHRMPMGSGLIGTAAKSGEIMLRSDLAADPDWKPNPLLPDTKGEIAVPIKLGDEVLGVLDIQSDQVGALSEDDRLLLEGLCGQIAIAIDQTRMRQEMEERLTEINRLYRTLSREGWQEFGASTALPEGFEFTQMGIQPVISETEDQTVFAAPLSVPGGAIVGTLAIDDTPENPLSPEDQAFLEQVSEQVALALESARLFEQTQASLAETQSLYRFNEAISGETDLEVIYQTVAQMSCEEMGFSGSWIAVYEPENETLHGVAGVNLPEENIKARLPLDDKTPATLAGKMRQSVIVNQPDHDERMGDIPKEVRTVMGKALAMPIMIGKDLLGVISVTRAEGTDIGPREERMLQVVATQLAIAMQRVQLFQQAQTRSEELDILNEMGRTLTSLQDENAIYETIYEYTGKLMDVSSFHIALYHEDQQEYSLPIMTEQGQRIQMPNQPAANGLTDYIIKTRQPLLFKSDVDANAKALGIDPIIVGEDLSTQSWLGVPLIFQDRIIGVVAVQSDTTPGLYTEHERDLLTAIASQAAIALENASAFRQTQQQAEREAMINLISQRIQSTTSVEDALQVAIRELGRALGAKRTNIQLGISHPQAPKS